MHLLRLKFDVPTGGTGKKEARPAALVVLWPWLGSLLERQSLFFFHWVLLEVVSLTNELLAIFSIYRLDLCWQLIRVQCETNLRFKVRGKWVCSTWCWRCLLNQGGGCSLSVTRNLMEDTYNLYPLFLSRLRWGDY